DRDAGGGDDEGGGGADVERRAAVAAGAAGVQRVPAGFQRHHVLAQHGGGGGQLGRGFALHAQGDEQGGHLGLAAAAVDEALDDLAHALVVEVAPLDQGGEGFDEVHRASPAGRSVQRTASTAPAIQPARTSVRKLWATSSWPAPASRARSGPTTSGQRRPVRRATNTPSAP